VVRAGQKEVGREVPLKARLDDTITVPSSISTQAVVSSV
jgi:hypothetical protein